MNDTHAIDEPWFHNPWVWLMISIPALTVVGCMVTIYLAISNPDYRVDDTAKRPQTESAESLRP